MSKQPAGPGASIEDKLIEELLTQDSIDLTLIENFSQLAPETTGLLCLEGIKGSMDCKIDGILCDVKSTSTYGFKKFKENRLEYDDPFGYIDQLSGYGQAEGADEAMFLAMDKQNGHLTTTKIS